MNRPISIRCSWKIHNRAEVDEAGRVFCSRCGERRPVHFKQIQAPELEGRQLTRKRTRGEKL